MAATDDEINLRMFRMTTLSPHARACNDGEVWRCVLETDDVTNETVQQELFLCMLDDLKTLGMYIAVPPDELYNNNTLLDQTLDIFEYIFPNSLYPKMRGDNKLVLGLTGLIDGTVTSSEPLYEYLDWLGGTDSIQAYDASLREGCDFIKTRFTTDSIFYDYIAGMLDKLNQERSVPVRILDTKSHTEFPEYIFGLGNAMYTMVPAFASDYATHTDVLVKRINLSLMHLTKPDTLDDYAWCLLTQREELPAEQAQFYDRKLTELYRGFKLHPLYHTTRKGSPLTTLDMLGYVLYGYARSKTPDAFDKNMLSIRSHFTNPATVGIFDKMEALVKESPDYFPEYTVEKDT